LRNWETIKREERADASTPAAGGKATEPPKGTLDGLPADLPALLTAFRIGEKAARVGFDWPDGSGARAKLDEELGELDAVLGTDDSAAIEHELGDVLFSLTNIARHAGINPEMALRKTTARFRARFAGVEAALGERLKDA